MHCWCNHCEKQYGAFLKKLKIEPFYDPCVYIRQNLPNCAWHYGNTWDNVVIICKWRVPLQA